MPSIAHARRAEAPTAPDVDIDLERVVIDPEYRRRVISSLNAQAPRGDRPRPIIAHTSGDAIDRPVAAPKQPNRSSAPHHER
jgi:hypothetical protein